MKILQIIPADNYWGSCVRLNKEKNTADVYYEKIACFALVERDGKQDILPFSSNGHSIINFDDEPDADELIYSKNIPEDKFDQPTF